jgi:hypothetical protein
MKILLLQYIVRLIQKNNELLLLNLFKSSIIQIALVR